MSTNAMIWIKIPNQEYYKGVSIHWDGYINNGVGETLIRDWNHGSTEEKQKNVLNLMEKAIHGIRCFGENVDDCELYKEGIGIIYAKDLYEVINKGREYNYMLNQAGVWTVEDGGEWFHLNWKLKNLKKREWEKRYGVLTNPPKFKYEYDCIN